ncbi:MAG: hypothetical protein IIA87_03180 [Nanoarchaeota archaeon]|nr:hypothetical protein [Nanoarchaeota archaeon]
MNIKFLRASNKKKIVRELEEQFGVTELPYILIETGKEKIRGFSGNMTKDEILELSKIANVEIIGLYLLKKERDLRLSLDATQVLASQISKNIIEINNEQFNFWIRGKNLDIRTKEGVYVVKYKSDFVGCGVSNGKKIFNYVPKERRIRN